MLLKQFCCLVFALVSSTCLFSASADRWCFTLAQTYFEQVYCQIQASGKTKGLPSYYDFKQNNDMTQGLLLRRFAPRVGIQIKVPRVSNKAKTVRASVNAKSSADVLSHCRLENNSFHCQSTVYRLVGNKNNDALEAGALKPANRMQLPEYQGLLSDVNAIDSYLLSSYTHYLEKMIKIGLGGSTLSYGKFVYLFNDLREKGISFSGRFETMYSYLKKDKQRLSVPLKSQAPAQMSHQDCYPLSSLLVCAFDTSNWIFSSR